MDFSVSTLAEISTNGPTNRDVALDDVSDSTLAQVLTPAVPGDSLSLPEEYIGADDFEDDWFVPERYLTRGQFADVAAAFKALQPLPSDLSDAIVNSTPLELRLLTESYLDVVTSQPGFDNFLMTSDFPGFSDYASEAASFYYAAHYLPFCHHFLDRLMRLRSEALSPVSQELFDLEIDDDDMGDSGSACQTRKRLGQRAPAKSSADEVPAKKSTRSAPVPASSDVIPVSPVPVCDDVSDSALARISTPAFVSTVREDLALSDDDSSPGSCSSPIIDVTPSELPASKTVTPSEVPDSKTVPDCPSVPPKTPVPSSTPASSTSTPTSYVPRHPFTCPPGFIGEDLKSEAFSAFQRLEPLPASLYDAIAEFVPPELRDLADRSVIDVFDRAQPNFLLTATFQNYRESSIRIARTLFSEDYFPLLYYLIACFVRVRSELLSQGSQRLLDLTENGSDDDDDMGDSVQSPDLAAIGAAYKESMRDSRKRLGRRAPAKLPVVTVPANKPTKPAPMSRRGKKISS